MRSLASILRAPAARWSVVGILLVAVIGVGAFSRWMSTRQLLAAPLRVGFRNSPPFYFATPDGQPRGMAIDVLNEAARRLGATLQWTQIGDADGSGAAIRARRLDAWSTAVIGRTDPSLYVTDPWLESTYFLIFRKGAGIAGVKDLAGRKVALLNGQLEDVLGRRVLGRAVLEFVQASPDKLKRVCDGSVDAAFVDGREGQAYLLERPPGCERTDFDFAFVDGASWSYGIGVLPERRRIADLLRGEIASMGEDGSLAQIQARWSFTTTTETRSVYALQQARMRGIVSAASIVMLGIALVAALWQVRRIGQARRRAEEEARREERYRTLFERNLAGVFRTTPDGRILDCNDAFARMLGCQSRDDLLTHEVWDFYPDRLTREAALVRLREQGSLASHEIVVRRRDGKSAVLLENSTLVDPGDGSPAYLEGTILDITRLRELEDQYRQAQKLESVGLLAGGIAHDFNNALTAINGYADLLLGELDEGDPRRGMVEEIASAGRHAETLTRQLLAFSRRQILQPKVLNLNHVIGEVGTLIRRTIGERIELRTDLAADLWLMKADPGQLQQVLLNLTVNARDAMPDGGRFTMSTANLDTPPSGLSTSPPAFSGPCVRLSVADTGHGMDGETRRRAFEPFFTTKERGKGTGLGLSTVYGIVRQSGGDLRVISEPGQGAIFEIFFPRVEAEAEGALLPTSPVGPRGGRETILVVEDQADVRRLAAEVLARQGYRVLQAGDADEAVRMSAAQTGTIHLLLVDVVMPGMHGPAVAELLRASRPGLKVLFMSGYTDDQLRNDAEAGGAGAFIQKPFAPTRLAATVREILDQE
jgi:PAS domain S-box-containing protein